MNKLLFPAILIILFSCTLTAQWMQTNGPYGAYITSLCISETNIFAGARPGGVFVSSDDGVSWAYSGLTNEGIYALAAVQGNLFAGAGSDGVFRSTDDGKQWTYAGLVGSEVISFAVRESTLYAGTWGRGVFFSTNRH